VFAAMLRRDAMVARRNWIGILVSTALQPLMLTLVFGYLLPHMGFVSDAYKAALLPGVIAITLMLSSLQAVALPLVIDFGYSNQIEDRLLAPAGARTLVAGKIGFGILQGTIAALLVLPVARLVMGTVPGMALANLAMVVPITLLGAAVFSAIGMVLGTAIPPQRVNLFFSALLTPLITFGCVYYPWTGLARTPVIQFAVLLNPLVYLAEGLRGALTPASSHMPIAVTVGAMALLAAGFWLLGQITFERRAIG
jgi:ABC-2 type transport system permease protein